MREMRKESGRPALPSAMSDPEKPPFAVRSVSVPAASSSPGGHDMGSSTPAADLRADGDAADETPAGPSTQPAPGAQASATAQSTPHPASAPGASADGGAAGFASDAPTDAGFTPVAAFAPRGAPAAAHPLDDDPWPSFLEGTLGPDAPTLVETTASPTRASVMSVYVGPHVIAALSYLFWWVSGLVVYYKERRNRFVRFHAVQSILLTATLTIFGVLAYVASNLLFDIAQATHQHIYMTIGQGVALLAFFLVLMFWLAPMIAAWSGAYLRMPIIGDYAERFAAIPIEIDSASR